MLCFYAALKTKIKKLSIVCHPEKALEKTFAKFSPIMTHPDRKTALRSNVDLYTYVYMSM